jgi:hypothetical protein
MTYQMPTINIEKLELTAADKAVARRIVNTRTGELRASKPAVAKQIKIADDSWMGYHHDYANKQDAETGIAAYVWRMVVFQVSQNPQHQCMPCTADFDLPGHYGDPVNKLAQQRADAIVDAIVNSIPVHQWAGVQRWGQAFGMVGTPSYDKEGAVIYR